MAELFKTKTIWLIGLLAAVQFGTAVLPVTAAPAVDAQVSVLKTNVTTVSDVTLSADTQNLLPVCVSDIFDAEFYRNRYPDVAAAIGDNAGIIAAFYDFWAEGETCGLSDSGYCKVQRALS